MGKNNANITTPIAPEDIRSGQYVAILHLIIELLPCTFEPGLAKPQAVRVRMLPCYNPPFRVIDVCLPLVTVKEPDGDITTLDLRRYELGRVHRKYGKRVFKSMKKMRKRS